MISFSVSPRFLTAWTPSGKPSYPNSSPRPLPPLHWICSTWWNQFSHGGQQSNQRCISRGHQVGRRDEGSGIGLTTSYFNWSHFTFIFNLMCFRWRNEVGFYWRRIFAAKIKTLQTPVINSEESSSGLYQNLFIGLSPSALAFLSLLVPQPYHYPCHIGDRIQQSRQGNEQGLSVTLQPREDTICNFSGPHRRCGWRRESAIRELLGPEFTP